MPYKNTAVPREAPPLPVYMRISLPVYPIFPALTRVRLDFRRHVRFKMNNPGHSPSGLRRNSTRSAAARSQSGSETASDAECT